MECYMYTCNHTYVVECYTVNGYYMYTCNYTYVMKYYACNGICVHVMEYYSAIKRMKSYHYNIMDESREYHA